MPSYVIMSGDAIPTVVRDAIFRAFYRRFGIQTAFRFAMWSDCRRSGFTIEQIAKRLGRQRRTIFAVMFDDQRELRLDTISDIYFAMGAELDFKVEAA